MKPAEMLLWIKALQEVLCEYMNSMPFGSEDVRFIEAWLVDVNEEYMKASAPSVLR